MAFEFEKTMFEVYRETTYTNQFRVVYFTELQDHNKESEINRAMDGEHFVDGFIRDLHKEEAKGIIVSLIARMNDGGKITPEQFLAELGGHLA